MELTDIQTSQGHAHINNINNNQKHLTIKNTNLHTKWTIGLYRPKPNKEQDYPKTNQQIKAQAIPVCYIFLCFLWQTFVKHEADKDIQTSQRHEADKDKQTTRMTKNTDYLNMNNH